MGMTTLKEMAFLFLCVGLCLADASGASAPCEDGSTNEAVNGTRGTVEGIVIYRADPSRPWRYARYYVNEPQKGELAEAVVSLSGGMPGGDSEKGDPATVVIDQKDFRFIPETVAIRAGDRVKFQNSDAAVHNVFVFDPGNQFNVHMPAGSEHIETFKTPGGSRRPMQVGCVYHSAMRAWVYVFDHPHFQVTGPNGCFRMKNVPPGNYTVEVVHPAGKLRWHKDVEVTAGKPVKLRIELSADNLVKSIRAQESGDKPPAATSAPSEEDQ